MLPLTRLLARPLPLQASRKFRSFSCNLPHRMVHVESIPMWTGSHDNYAYLVIDDETKDAMVVDPANPPEVLPVLKEQIDAGNIKLKAIINTHHHYDHAGGNKATLKEYPHLQVIGGHDCEAKTTTPAHNSTFKIGNDLTVTALHTPCHTQDSICYFVKSARDGTKVVFTGDTLFIAGCGRFFEGTAEEMHKALNETLAALPSDTKVYPGHEYTKSNIRFVQSVVDTVTVQKVVQFCEANKETQGKFTIGDEKNHNVFMMVEDPLVQQATGETDPVKAMQKLRDMKNSFK